MLTEGGKLAPEDIQSFPYAIKSLLWLPLRIFKENQCFSVKLGGKASGHWKNFKR